MAVILSNYLQDWADQYLHELNSQSAYRSNLLQGLIAAQDWEACREFIDEWEKDDKAPDSIAQKYQRVANHLRQLRANVSANSLSDSSAGVPVHSIDQVL